MVPMSYVSKNTAIIPSRHLYCYYTSFCVVNIRFAEEELDSAVGKDEENAKQM